MMLLTRNHPRAVASDQQRGLLKCGARVTVVAAPLEPELVMVIHD
jgi:hypothetical protein